MRTHFTAALYTHKPIVPLDKMSDALNPTGPAQPSLSQVYETAGNPAQKEPAEEAQSRVNATSNAPVT